MKARSHIVNLPRALSAVRFAAPRSAGGQAEEFSRQKELAAYERGRIDGEKNLSALLLQQRNEMLQLQQGVLKSLQEAVPEVVRQCEGALTALTLELAQKLVAGLPISAERVEAAIREALRDVEETTDYHLYLNPEDHDLLQQTNSPLLASNGSSRQFHFHRSPEISRGGCLVKTRFGVVDAQCETKIELLKKSLIA